MCGYEELVSLGNGSIDLFWPKNELLMDPWNQPPPEAIEHEIIEDLEAALEQFRLIEADHSTADKGAGI